MSNASWWGRQREEEACFCLSGAITPLFVLLFLYWDSLVVSFEKKRFGVCICVFCVFSPTLLPLERLLLVMWYYGITVRLRVLDSVSCRFRFSWRLMAWQGHTTLRSGFPLLFVCFCFCFFPSPSLPPHPFPPPICCLLCLVGSCSGERNCRSSSSRAFGVGVVLLFVVASPSERTGITTLYTERFDSRMDGSRSCAPKRAGLLINDRRVFRWHGTTEIHTLRRLSIHTVVDR